MSYRQRNNFFSGRGENKKNYLPIIIVSFFVIIFSLSWTKNLLFSIGYSLWAVKNNTITFFSDNIAVLNSKKNLLSENSLLKKQIKSKERDYAILGLLKNENEDLKNILNRKSENQKFLLSAVLVKPFISPYDTLVIDVGTSNGVTVGDGVVAEGNVYIGRISEVYYQSSKVVLYSSPGEKVKILIGNTNIEKEATGLGGGNFSVEIPREIDIKEGDSIVIPSITTNVFGIVEKIEFKESDSFQNILFKNSINVSELKWVEVLLSNKK